MPRFPNFVLLSLLIIISGGLSIGPAMASEGPPDEIPHPARQPKPVADVPLSEALRLLPAKRLIELTLPEGQFARGYAVQVSNDTLHLRRDKHELAPVTPYPLAEILRVREWRTNTSRGAGTGAISGAIVIGGFGILVGLAIASWDADNNDDYVAPVIATTLLGAGVGAFAGGVLGAGMGSLISSWQPVWPGSETPRAPQLPDEPVYSHNTRVNLFAGGGRTLLPEYEVTSLVGRVSLHKTLGQRVSLGPTIGYHNFGGHEVLFTSESIEVRSRDDILMMALTGKVRGARSGFAPYATAGAGWFLGNEAFIGGHLGGGLHWQTHGSTDLELDIRYHFNFSRVDSDQIDRFWTVGLNFGFGI